MVPEIEIKEEPVEDEPISLLVNKDICKEKVGVELKEEVIIEAKNGDASLISAAMVEEEQKLEEQRVRQEESPNKEAPTLDEVQFTKLDELLTQTQLYSEFLLEKMDDITKNGFEEDVDEVKEEKKKGRGLKREYTTNYNNGKAKRAVAAMLTRSREGIPFEDFNLSKEERAEKEQAELVPLMTGGKLKPYQVKGVKWLISLWQNGLNGILADQMGLGKTIQTIGFLAHLKGKGSDGPYMIIAPLSTLSNWANEISRFAPCLNAIIYHGSKKDREEIRMTHMPFTIGKKFPIVITSYEVVMNDAKKYLRHYNWKYLVVDEVVAKLHAILRPFLLRRMKEDVEHMLPRKKEIILYATLTDHQKNFHDHLVNRTLEQYLKEKVNTGRGMKGKLNHLMIQLRKNCNHPDLLEGAFEGSCFYPPVEQIVGQCGKFQLLERLLQKLFSRKHKVLGHIVTSKFGKQVLIFSQWTKVLDIMHYYFSEKDIEVCRIDGSVGLEERRRQIAEFNDVNSSYRVFLLSTRAGGLGINLTSADTCILYDSDWNPQMDLQAMDRCHRIGQTKPVHVYRLATAQSVEGRILKRAFSKLKLEHVVIGKGHFKQERTKASSKKPMEEEEIVALLKSEEDAEDKKIQTDISDEDLERVLDRSDLIAAGPVKAEGKPDYLVSKLPLKGPGWEVVIPSAAGGMLSTVNN
ncbi:hypothetical protein CTI12_AA184810 [Artemisia annua]|uniref:Uncharacterized protein n=1 Tax=Artemisia annua TaxID=35608 RepID=A0A2U1P7S5_ARTAN|nr:hypothetical protein CTI12_AA184810 [Artemisia annua]